MKPTKNVTVSMNVWYREEGQIGLSINNGWFITTETIKNQQIRIVSKDGGVAGFTSWIALEQRPAPGTASPRGLFILTNGPDATTLGKRAFGYLIPPASAPVDEAFLQSAAPAPDPRVH